MAYHDPQLPAEAVPLQPEKSLGELFSAMTSDIGDLVSSHIDLAKAEIKQEVTQTGRAAGVLGAGVFAAYMVVVMLSFTVAWALAAVMPTWVGFLIVTLVWAAAAAVLIVTGKTKAQAVQGPEQTIETVKEDVEWAKHQKS